jgi:hypothetical protein
MDAEADELRAQGLELPVGVDFTSDCLQVFGSDIFGTTLALIGVADLVEGRFASDGIAVLDAERARTHRADAGQPLLKPSDVLCD